MPWEQQQLGCSHPERPPIIGIAMTRALTGRPKLRSVWRCEQCGQRFKLCRSTEGGLYFKKIGG